MADYFIGLDVGTTSTKAIVFTATGDVKGSANYGYSLLTPQPGWAEQDPQVIFQAVWRSLKDAIAQAQVSASSIAAIGMSSAMHSLIAIDRQNKLLTQSMIWADHRSAEQATTLKNSSIGLNLYQQTGTPIHPMSPLTKLLWMRDRDPELFAQADRFISIKEYIIFQLFGQYIVDYSIASATGLFNLRQQRWDADAIALTGLQESQLSELVPTTTILRGMKQEFADAIGLHSETPFVLGASDGVLANLGIGAIAADQVAITIGTSSAVRQVVTEPLTDTEGRTFCYHLMTDRWVIGGPSNNGGITLRWYRDTFGAAEVQQAQHTGIDAYELLIRSAADIAPGAEGLLFLPFLSGERAPYWNANARGIFFGAALHHTRSHFTRAVLESIVLSVYSITRVLHQLTGKPREIRAAGGFARSTIWLQMMADIFGETVFVPQVYESSGFGAALLAMLSVGCIHDLSDVDRLIFSHDRYQMNRYQPNAAFTEKYQTLFAIYQAVYFKTVEEMNRLLQL